MDLKDKADDLVRSNLYFTLFLIAFILLELIIANLKFDRPLSWDPAVYTSMGKYIYSLGSYGFWEVFRPPVITFFAGIPYLLGISNSFTHIIMIAISATGLVTMYGIVKSIFTKRIAFYSTAVLASSDLFLQKASVISTEIAASFLILYSAYMLGKNKFMSGFIVSLAFLTRFPSAIVGIAYSGIVTVISYSNGRYRKIITQNLYLFSGFIILTGVYFILNQLAYGSFLEPITGAISVPTQNPAVQNYGIYYLKNMILSQPFFALFPLGVYFLIRDKIFDQRMYFFLTFLTLYLFQEAFPHKEPRYALIFMPLSAIYTGVAIDRINDYFKTMFSFDGKLFFKLIVALIISTLMIISFGEVFVENNWEIEEETQFIDQVDQLPESASVLGNHPNIPANGNFEYTTLPVGSIEKVYNRQEDIDYIAIDHCAWYSLNQEDDKEIQSFENYLEQEYYKNFQSQSKKCRYTIYTSSRE